MTKAYPVDRVHQQTRAIVLAWGMTEEHATTTADLLIETDLRGVAARANTPFLLA